MSLTFDPEAHVYRWKDRIVPSVTQVLGEWQTINVYGKEYYCNVYTGEVVDVEVFRQAAFFGKEVHAGAKLILENNLDWNGLDPALERVLRQFEKWVIDYDVEPRHVEVPIYSDKLDVAGTPDFIGYIRRINKRRLAIVDWKTGEYAMVGPQTAGYGRIFKDQHRYRFPLDRYVLELPKDGSDYSFLCTNNPADETFFKARAFQYNHLRGLHHVTA